jgi:hypothetical protein
LPFAFLRQNLHAHWQVPELTAFFSLFTHLFSFGPQSARAGGEVIHVDSIDHYSGVVPTGRRGLGIFPLARVALASEAIGLPGEQPVDHKADPNKLHKSVKYTVKNAVVTLIGEVNTQAQRAMAEKVASQVPNVKQVVNELQVKNQKATSSK